MQTATEAEEHLRVIRSLMEKATIYRAISAPTALVGGVSSITFGGWLHLHGNTWPELRFERHFLLGWLLVLAVTVCANALFIWLAARRRGESFISPAMRKALWALFPPMLCGAFFTIMLSTKDDLPSVDLPPVWMLFYGLGLLATAQFAPKSIPLLGWCFLIAGLLAISGSTWDWWPTSGKLPFLSPTLGANLLMVLTFGAFHIIYAACTWRRRRPSVEISGTP